MQPHLESEPSTLHPTDAADDQLLAWQLRVSRRADELVRTKAVGTAFASHCWLLAEAEIMGKAWPRDPAAPSSDRP